MPYLTGFDRQQTSLIPGSIDELIPQDSLLRLIDLFVESMNLKQTGFLNDANSDNGRPYYSPADLFKLYIFGFLNSVRTSGLLEKKCKRNIKLLWLLRENCQYFRRKTNGRVAEITFLFIFGPQVLLRLSHQLFQLRFPNLHTALHIRLQFCIKWFLHKLTLAVIS
jgi:transposase